MTHPTSEKTQENWRQLPLRWVPPQHKYTNYRKRRGTKREAAIKKRARLLGVEHVPYVYNDVVFGTDTCALCGEKYKAGEKRSIDHIIPMSDGGSDSLDNVQSAHHSCNTAKENERRQKILTRIRELAY